MAKSSGEAASQKPKSPTESINFKDAGPALRVAIASQSDPALGRAALADEASNVTHESLTGQPVQ